MDKFFLKPWNDQNLKLEIIQALKQYDLIADNEMLHEKVLKTNQELKSINQNLETIVEERTRNLEIQNRALELSRAILEDLPVPIIGISPERMVVIINRETQSLSNNNKPIEIGKRLEDYFSDDVEEKTEAVLATNRSQTLKGYRLSEVTYDIDFVPLSERFQGKGVIMVLKATGD